jgi:hypothetical protein
MPSPLTDTLEALETEIARRSRREKLLRIADSRKLSRMSPNKGLDGYGGTYAI